MMTLRPQSIEQRGGRGKREACDFTFWRPRLDCTLLLEATGCSHYGRLWTACGSCRSAGRGGCGAQAENRTSDFNRRLQKRGSWNNDEGFRTEMANSWYAGRVVALSKSIVDHVGCGTIGFSWGELPFGWNRKIRSSSSRWQGRFFR